MIPNLHRALEIPALKAALALVALVAAVAFFGSLYWIGDLLRLLFQPSPDVLRPHFPPLATIIFRVAYRCLPVLWAVAMCVTAVSVIQRRPGVRQALGLAAWAGIVYLVVAVPISWMQYRLSTLVFMSGLLAVIVVLLRRDSVRVFCESDGSA